MIKVKKVAVTGAGGKVGKQVVKELLSKDYEVLSITHSPKGCPGKEVSLDIKDYNRLVDVLKGQEAVIHLAAIPNPIKGKDTLVMETNLVGSYNIMKAAAENNIKRIALASTDCTLGFTFSKNRPNPEYLPVDEKHPLRPDDSYGLSKVLMERAAEAIVQRYPGMSIASLRITYVANPEEYNFKYFASNPQGFDPSGHNLWSYIDNRDAARAFRKAIEINLGGHEVFFIAADNTRCIIPTKELIERYFPEAKLKKQIEEFESLENNSKAKKLLDFEPEFKWNEESGI